MRHSSVLPLAGVIALAMAGSALAQEGGRISVGASLEGELTGRFAAKALLIAVIGGLAFAYYRDELDDR